MQAISGFGEKENVALRHRRFEELVDAYSTDLYRYAVWLGNDSTQAEDLVQETFARAWRFFDALEDQASAKAWLFTILRREHARQYERHMPALESLDDLDLDHWSPEPSESRHSTYGLIRRLLEALPLTYREPLALQVIGGYSAEEIGRIMDLRTQAVLTRLYRAREMLKARFDDGHTMAQYLDTADELSWDEALVA